ncbi:heptosyltransferase [unidentified eubacterium SCB49]|nr:heptosyltransferase [unidentified eubacterium SCB49]
MGDAAMAVPVLRTLLQTYPDVKLTVITKPFFTTLFKDLPRTSCIAADVYGEHKNFGLIKLAKQAQQQGIDAVADLHNVLRSKTIRNYLKLNGIPTAKIDKGRAEKKELIKAQGGKISQLKTTQQRYADVFAELGLPIDLANHEYPKQKQLTEALHKIIGKHSKKL